MAEAFCATHTPGGCVQLERESGLAPEPSPWRAMLYIKLFPPPLSQRSYVCTLEAPGGFEPPVFAVLQTAPFGQLGYGAIA